jgi:hypothetical protein
MAAVNKRSKYSSISADVDFVPVVVETTGVWGSDGLALIREIGRRIASVRKDPRSTSFLMQRISVAIMRGNFLSVSFTLSPSPLAH